MTYLAQTEGLDLVEDPSYMRKLQDAPPPGASAPGSSPGGGGDIGLQCVQNLALYAPDTQSGSLADDTLEDSADDTARCARIAHYFSYTGELKLSMSSRAVHECRVDVGSALYLDAMHTAMPADVMQTLRFSKKLGPNEFSPPISRRKASRLDIATFRKKCSNHRDFYPVLECMLLYEMPESIVAHNEDCDTDFLVWVGTRQRIASAASPNKYTTRYFTVSTKMLVAREKLQDVGISLAVFDSCL